MTAFLHPVISNVKLQLVRFLVLTYFMFSNSANSQESCDMVVTRNGLQGVITSPNYPRDRYPRNCDSTYRLGFDDRPFVALIINALDLESHSRCGHDYLAIYDGPSTTYPQIQKLCGSIQHPRRVQSSGNYLTFKFHSDSSLQKSGFSITFLAAGLFSSLGIEPINTVFPVPDSVWVDTPAINRISDDVYEVLGRKVYLHTVHELLVKTRRFPLKLNTNVSPRMLQLIIKADTVYLDQSLNFQGLKKLTIKARKFVSNGKTLTLQAPDVCHSIWGSTCSSLQKARNMRDGANGKNGIASAALEIYVYELQGNINIVSKGSNGNIGQDGGDGNPGQDNRDYITSLTDVDLCGNGWLASCKYDGSIKGNRGHRGGDGEDGRRAGLSGNGGSASSVTIYTEKILGYVKLKQLAGFGGPPAKHGRGGEGGAGGNGGCGMICYDEYIDSGGGGWGGDDMSYPVCTSEVSCKHRGDKGYSGYRGADGSSRYPRPKMGNIGSVESSDMRLKSNVKIYFQNESQLLSLIQRRAEFLFKLNKTTEAADIFRFIVSVTSESSDLFGEASVGLKMIKEGRDYYGHTEEYAPDWDWSELSRRVDSLLEIGEDFEETYNRIKQEIDDIAEASNDIRLRYNTTSSMKTDKKELRNNQMEIMTRKNFYVNALKRVEKTMLKKSYQIHELLPRALTQVNVQITISNVLSLIGGIAGFFQGMFQLDPTVTFNGALWAIGALRSFGPACDAPTLIEASETLRERINFGYEYQRVEPEDLDFATMDISALPIIMRSNLEKNKDTLAKELRCLFSNGDLEAVANLELVIKAFYSDAGSRINLIDSIMNMDVQLKKISFSLSLLEEARKTLDAAFDSAESNIPVETMDFKMTFKDYMLSLYQEQEITIMRSLYELSKAYQFTCLWKFDVLEKYNNIFSSEVMVSNLNSLEGIAELQRVRRELEDQRRVFLRYSRRLAGPASHTYTKYWEFNNASHPDVIADLHTDGQFSLNIEVDPNDIETSGCNSCYNGRLAALYVELTGEDQPRTVPNKIYVKVSHRGDSSFLVPLRSGRRGLMTFRQTPEDLDGGRVMSFNPTNLVPVSTTRQYHAFLRERFSRKEHIVCDTSISDPELTFFGRKPCKSPYASYDVIVPRDNVACSLDPRYDESGTNCRDLDFTRFNAVKIYAQVKSWSNYPVQPDEETLRRYARALRADSEAE